MHHFVEYIYMYIERIRYSSTVRVFVNTTVTKGRHSICFIAHWYGVISGVSDSHKVGATINARTELEG